LTKIREMSGGWAVAGRATCQPGAGMENWAMMSPPCAEQPGPATDTRTVAVPGTGTTMTAAGWLP
jgi:hypothetical protein